MRHSHKQDRNPTEEEQEYSLDELISLVNRTVQDGPGTSQKNITPNRNQNYLFANLSQNQPIKRDKQQLPPLEHSNGFVYHIGYDHSQRVGDHQRSQNRIGNADQSGSAMGQGNPNNPNKKLLIFKPWSGKIPENIIMQHSLKSTEKKRTEEEKTEKPLTFTASEPINQEIDDDEEEEKQLVALINKKNIHEQLSDAENDSNDCIRDDPKQQPLPTTDHNSYYYKFQNGKVKLIKYLLDENGFKDIGLVRAPEDEDEQENSTNWTIYWATTIIKAEVYSKLQPYQKINHFPNSYNITRKDLMNQAISKMQYKYGYSNFNFLPKTYILPQELEQVRREFDSGQSSYTYIVKPHNRSQGRGISVTTSFDTILSKLEKYSSLIVSHYIDNPLLINKLKFDLRIYVAVTSVNPLRIYVYEEGLARFATQEYQPYNQSSSGPTGKFQHLTNYSINKKNLQHFVQSAQNELEYYGSKWSLTALKDFRAYNIGRNETTELFHNVDDLIIKTILSVENLLYTSFFTSSTSASSKYNVPFINNCFEVLGFDVMIDSNLKPWLIEVNMSPSMNTDSALDLKIKGNMIADLFTMIGVVSQRERYVDGGWSRFECKHYFHKNDNTEFSNRAGLNAVDKFILKEVEAENERSGGFRRVFPTQRNQRYKNFFEKDRYYNKLLREKLFTASHHSIPTKIQAPISHPPGKYSTGSNLPLYKIPNKRTSSNNYQSLPKQLTDHKKLELPKSNNYATVNNEDDEEIMKILEATNKNPLSSNKMLPNQITSFKNISVRINRSKKSVKNSNSDSVAM